MVLARVLIADDESAVRQTLRLALESDGYTVDEAADGRAAIETVDRWSPDVLLLDLIMPVLDGMGVLNELQRLRPGNKPRVIVLSGHGSIPIAVKAMRLGAMDFLEKPAAIAEVREAISAVLSESAPTGIATTPDADMPVGGYAAVVDRIRRALRLTNYPLAEILLMKAEDLAHTDAAYFNLLGIYYESRRQWRAAKKFFGRAMAANEHYKPAQINMRRLLELTTLGRTEISVAYGDEPEFRCSESPVAGTSGDAPAPVNSQ